MPARRRSPLFLPDGRGRYPRPCGGEDRHGPELPEVADCRELSLTPGRTLRTRVAGVFLFLPLLAKLGFDRLVVEARYPGSEMVPAPAALLSLLALKLLDKERRSHIGDFNFDEALGLFAGLNVLPGLLPETGPADMRVILAREGRRTPDEADPPHARADHPQAP